MSYRTLQYLGTLLLLTIVVVVGVMSITYSRHTVEYMNMVVDVHNPTLEGFDMIEHHIQILDKTLSSYESQSDLRINELKIITSRMVEVADDIAVMANTVSRSTRMTGEVKKLSDHIGSYKSSHVLNVSEIDVLKKHLFSISQSLRYTYQKSNEKVKKRILPSIQVMRVLDRNVQLALGEFLDNHSVDVEDIVQPLIEINKEVIKIKKILTAGDSDYHVYESELSNMHSEHEYNHDMSSGMLSLMSNELDKLLLNTNKLYQSINIYAEERLLIDPSASQVIGTLKIVKDLVSQIEHHVKYLDEIYQNHAYVDQNKLLIDSESKQKIFIISMLLGIMIATFGTLFVNRVVIKDINELVQGTNMFSEGEYQYRIKPSRLAEFNNLSESFNAMAENISEQDNKLRKNVAELDVAHGEVTTAKNDLEIKVEERTSELTRAMEEAKSSERAKSTFLANMSHELRTPLHGILSFAGFGISKVGSVSEERIKKYFSQIDASGTRLKVLLDDLLDLSKLEAGKMELNISRVNLPKLIEECVAEQYALLSSHELEVDLDFAVDFPPVACDRNRMGQVIMNILGNAIKFSPDSGHIKITGVRTQLDAEGESSIDAVQISIADQGTGIPEEELETIFKKFVQSESNEYSSGGTGLGLAITRELIHAHQGHIWADNAEDGGAVFHFVLPLDGKDA